MPIDPTKPSDGVPASKTDLRNNLQAIKDAIDNSIATNATASITVNAASFSDHQYLTILCTNAGSVAVTLANDVPAGCLVELVQYGAGTGAVTASAGAGATLVAPSGVSALTSTRYEAIMLKVDSNSGTNAAWRLIGRP